MLAIKLENPSFHLNREPVRANAPPDRTLLDWLRCERGLRGTKEGCAEGDCGACTVLISRGGRYRPANACIVLLGQIDGASVLTVEGLGREDRPHPVQAALAKGGGAQCGYCTPGFVMAITGLLEATSRPDDDAVHDALAGNLCRCTGYRPIVDAVHEAARAGVPRLEVPAGIASDGRARRDAAASRAREPGPSAPPPRPAPAAAGEFHAPTTLDELLALRAARTGAVLLAGGTDLNLRANRDREPLPDLIHTGRVAALREVCERGGALSIGGAASYDEMLPAIDRHWPSFARIVRRFGSAQIRSQATLAGNIGTASPIGDSLPCLIALGARVELASSKGIRIVPLDGLFTGYRETAIRSDEVIARIEVPLPGEGDEFRAWKISKRYDQDIATVCGAFALRLGRGGSVPMVREARIAFGGMAPVPARCERAESALAGKALDWTAAGAAADAVRASFAPISDVRGSADYRREAAANLLLRLHHELAENGSRRPVEVMDIRT